MTDLAVKTAPSGGLEDRIAAWSGRSGIDRSGWVFLANEGILGVSSRPAPAHGLLEATRRLVQGQDLGVVASYLINEICARLVSRLGDGSRVDLVPALLAGRENVSLAITEPEAGSDLQAIRTTAQERPDGSWVLAGKKILVSNGPIADHFVVATRSGPPSRSALRGVTLFLVPRGAEGLVCSGPLPTAGIPCMPIGELVLSQCAVPASAVLGKAHRGLQYLMETLLFERLTIAIGALAATEMYLARFVPYLSERAVFGRTLATYDTIRDSLGGLRARHLAVEALVEQLVREFDAGRADASRIMAAKIAATELLESTAALITRLSGGRGFLTDHWAANLQGEVRWMCIAGGANDVLRGVLGKDLAHARMPPLTGAAAAVARDGAPPGGRTTDANGVG